MISSCLRTLSGAYCYSYSHGTKLVQQKSFTYNRSTNAQSGYYLAPKIISSGLRTLGASCYSYSHGLKLLKQKSFTYNRSTNAQSEYYLAPNIISSGLCILRRSFFLMAFNGQCRLPKLVVFDLDYTLWPFWVDSRFCPPFKRIGPGVYDSRNSLVPFYKDVPDILQKLRGMGIMIGVASRTACINEANQLIDLFGWAPFINDRQIYPGSKIPHFNRFHTNTGIPYSAMIFFDDESRNIQDVSRLGVHCVHTPDGMSMQVLDQTLRNFASNY